MALDIEMSGLISTAMHVPPYAHGFGLPDHCFGKISSLVFFAKSCDPSPCTRLAIDSIELQRESRYSSVTPALTYRAAPLITVDTGVAPIDGSIELSLGSGEKCQRIVCRPSHRAQVQQGKQDHASWIIR